MSTNPVNEAIVIKTQENKARTSVSRTTNSRNLPDTQIPGLLINEKKSMKQYSGFTI
jgi:hypothetical protein